MLRLKTSVWFMGLFALCIYLSPAAHAQTGEEIMKKVNSVMGHFPSAVAEVFRTDGSLMPWNLMMA